MSNQRSESESQVRFFGYEITAHFKDGTHHKFGAGYLITDGKFVHVLAGAMSRANGNLHLTNARFIKEICLSDVDQISYRESGGHVRFFNPRKKTLS